VLANWGGKVGGGNESKQSTVRKLRTGSGGAKTWRGCVFRGQRTKHDVTTGRQNPWWNMCKHLGWPTRTIQSRKTVAGTGW